MLNQHDKWTTTAVPLLVWMLGFAAPSVAENDLTLNSLAAGCVPVGGSLLVTLDLADVSEPVTGVQAMIEFDPAQFAVVSIAPGDGAGSPWDQAVEVAEIITSGRIVYAVGIVAAGTDNEATVAKLEFTALAEGTSSIAFFVSDPPFVSLLAGFPQGNPVLPVTRGTEPIETGLDANANGICDGEERDRARVSSDKKGSLVIFSKVEIKWDAAGNVTQDTFLDITNDYPKDVFVQMYFVNGDEPTDPVFAGDPPQLIERGHSGWNWVDCQIRLTNDQPMYWSALTGSPLGCQPFTVLDPGSPPGRPDSDGPPGSRVLRGFVYAWAVDQWGEEICWNHLKGDAVIVNYADPSAWEYNAWAAQTSDECLQGDAPDDEPGHICLNGREYDTCYDKLLLDFYASGSTALSGGGATVQVDTDLTLFPVDADLRQDTCGPVLTKAKFDVWNMNEIRFSGMTRCITCWDQTLASNYDPPNYFLLGNLHTDKGKARIDGIASQVCDANDCTECEWPKYPPCSQDAPLLGVVKKELAFSGGATGRAAAGMTLVGMGEESTCIWYDIIEPPGDLLAPGGDLVGPPTGVGKVRQAPPVSPR